MCRRLEGDEIVVGRKKFTNGFDFRTIAINPTQYLKWLHRRVSTSGVRIIQRRVSSLAELEGFDLIVNCTGLASTALVPDPYIVPARGVLLHVDTADVDRYYYNVKVCRHLWVSCILQSSLVCDCVCVVCVCVSI